ncbi:MAG: Gfo/Idh/MocA family oxidoreductase [Pleurocapsa minor GSE-CHR-MK-17-07R]|jgi:predicted dehydrogenase|nr:Gfo/Idh/MocA family oxidoreductase [Pleurocapsa minor GSE-CHR-MK 17-07R]
MRRLRIGVIGCGAVAQMMHLPHLTEYDEYFEVAGLADPHAPTLNAVGDRYGISRRTADYHDLLNDPSIDAVGIFHGGSHFQTVIDALEAGKHVFCEKPLAWNVREVETILHKASSSPAILQMGYHKRYDPAFSLFREHLLKMNEPGYGRITVLHPDDTLGWAAHRIRRGNGVVVEGHRDAPAFGDVVEGSRHALAEGELAGLVDEALGERRADPRLRLAYGMMTVSLIHQTYMLFGLLGEPTRVLHTDIWRGGLSINSLIEYPNDLRITLDWHYLGYLKDYKEEYAFFSNDERLYLTFPSPYFKNMPTPIIVQGHEGELAWEKRIIVNYEEAFKNELLAFHANVVNGTQPVTDVREAAQHARFIQAMIDAAR